MAFLLRFLVCFAVILGLAKSLPRALRTESENGLYCPSEYSMIELFPHPNCECFYKIVSGLTYEVYCPKDTHFNKITNCCEDYDTAKCVYGKAPLRPGAISETPDVPDEPEFPIEDEHFQSYLCIDEKLEGTFYAHPNCDRFYQDRQGTIYEMICPTGYEWNRNEACCDTKGASNCIFGLAPHRPSAIGL